MFSLVVPRGTTCRTKNIFLHVSNCSVLFVVLRVAVRKLFCNANHALPPTVVDVAFGDLHVPVTVKLATVKLNVANI